MADRTLDQVRQIVARAGELALADFGRFDTGLKVWDKSPGNPVSETDMAVDGFLRRELSAIVPDAGWLSEETLDHPRRLDHDRIWVVDPIDGTRDFVRGRPGWAISVALVEHGRPLFGVLCAPARQESWWAGQGSGAWRNGVALHASSRTQFSGSRVPADQLPGVDRDLVIVPKPNSIALRMAMVAADEADLLASLRWGYEWDICAAALIAGEAGAKVTDALGQDLRFNKARANDFGILCCAPAIHADAVARLADRAAEVIGKS